MSFPSEEEIAAMTPMMHQYYAMKKTMRDGILFFRMGDFYEIFGDDALEVAPKLDITLTAREKGEGKKIPFCGVPHHSAKNYWLKLLSMGYKVGIGDQVEDASQAKGLVKRALTKIYTPGCIDDLDALNEDRPNYLMAFYEDPESRILNVSVADVSTGELRCGEIKEVADLLPLVQRFRPRELVTRRFFQKDVEEILSSYLRQEKIVFGSLPESVLRDSKEQKKVISQVFGRVKIKGGEQALIASMMCYFRNLHASVEQFSAIKPLIDPDTINLNEVTRRDLELFETVRRRSREGSLFHEINRTLSPMGARLLHHSLLNPFYSKGAISHRQLGVRLLLDSESALKEVRSLLKGTPDLERLTTRVLSLQASPGELSKIRAALSVSVELYQLLNGMTLAKDQSYTGLVTDFEQARPVLEVLERCLSEQPTDLGEKLGLFAVGFDQEFDDLRQRAQNGEAEIKRYEEELRETTGISSLKVKRHKTYGLLIEVTKSNLSKVPEDFIRRQTMVNNERFITMELQELDESLSEAQVLAVERERQLYGDLLHQLGEFHAQMKLVGERLALFDLLQSFAFKALTDGYACPTLSRQGRIELRASRHPVVESFVGRHEFVPNDILIERDASSLVITGPNMGGKSTVMRQTALAAILHQIGSFLPCESAELPIFDGIYTRVGASDDLALGQSTFMVEMSETATILRQASRKSLVILDEVGRGTSTQDGMAIALAILEEMSEKLGCYLMFATHFYELLPVARKVKSVRIVQSEVLEGETISFTHRLKDGAANSSFGIEVAKLAGVPSRVIDKANHHLQTPCNVDVNKPMDLPKEPLKLGIQPEFHGESSEKQEVISKLMEMNLNRLTPFQALKRLYEFQDKLTNTQQFQLFND